MAIASETGEPTRQPSDCDCHNLFAKLRAQPGEAQPQKCCRHTKCTVAQLLELCKLDPDCIMNLFKLAKGDEKCLPEVEMDQAGTSENDKGKYHFLMVDNSTQGNEENSDKQDDDRLSEVKCMIQQAIGASTATDTDRDRFNNIIWTTSAMGTPNRPSPHQPPTPEETRPTVDQESKTHDKDRSSDNVWYNKSRSPEDSEINDRTTKTVKSYMESMNIVVEDGQQRPPLPVRTPSALDTDSFTREIFTRHNSPVDSEAQGSILKVIELKAGEREEENDALSASKASASAEQEDEESQSQRDASMMRKKSIIKSRSFTDVERDRGKSILWSDDALVQEKEIPCKLGSVPSINTVSFFSIAAEIQHNLDSTDTPTTTPTSEASPCPTLTEVSIETNKKPRRKRWGHALWRGLCGWSRYVRRAQERRKENQRRSTNTDASINPELYSSITKRVSRSTFSF